MFNEEERFPMLTLRHAALPALLLLAGLAAPRPAQAQLVANGGFETGDFTGWTVGGNANQGAASDTFVFGGPHLGDYAAWLGTPTSDGTLSQDIATAANEKYTISYFLSVDADPINGSTPNDFSASFGGQPLFSGTDLMVTQLAPRFYDPADYTEYTFSAVATGPTSTLLFGFRDDNSEFRLDDVSVTDAGPVPEASTTVSLGLLLALGLGGVIAAKRKTLNA